MSAELANVTAQQKLLMGLFEEVKQLKIQINLKDKRIMELEERLDDLEQLSRQDNLIITGMEIKRTYAKITSGEEITEDSSPLEQLTLEEQVMSFLQAKKIDIQHEDISLCHTLPSKIDKSKPVIVLKFISRKLRNKVIMQAKKLKGTNVYINEHLTKKNGNLAREARLLKKQNKVFSTWTRNGKVWIKVKEGSQPKIIKEMKDLDKFRQI